MSDSFDIIVIGGGTAGYPAAIRAAQLGMSVACIEKRPTLGGTCLNVGCIPSKALLHSSELYRSIQKDAMENGIAVQSTSIDFSKMMARKSEIIAGFTKGI